MAPAASASLPPTVTGLRIRTAWTGIVPRITFAVFAVSDARRSRTSDECSCSPRKADRCDRWSRPGASLSWGSRSDLPSESTASSTFAGDTLRSVSRGSARTDRASVSRWFRQPPEPVWASVRSTSRSSWNQVASSRNGPRTLTNGDRRVLGTRWRARG